jgi:hypothetical protein
MTVKKNIQNPMMAFDWIKDAFEYWLDSSQRWILFMDILEIIGVGPRQPTDIREDYLKIWHQFGLKRSLLRSKTCV